MTIPTASNPATATPATTKTAVALRHLAFEDLGILEPVLREAGYTIRYVEPGLQDTVSPIQTSDLVIVLGAPIGANDGSRYPFLDEEIGALRTRAQAGLPTLGICLDSHLLARALGASVAPSGHTEIAYASVELTPAGQKSPLRHLAATPVLHWHNDRFEIPDGAELLASTPVCANQAYSLGPNLLGLQFHLEVAANTIERWLIGHADALVSAGISPDDVRHDATKVESALTQAAEAAMKEWLSNLQPVAAGNRASGTGTV